MLVAVTHSRLHTEHGLVELGPNRSPTCKEGGRKRAGFISLESAFVVSFDRAFEEARE